MKYIHSPQCVPSPCCDECICDITIGCRVDSWWRHQMETFSKLLALCAGNTLEWCQLNALQASPVVHLVTPLSCVSLSMNTQPSVPAIVFWRKILLCYNRITMAVLTHWGRDNMAAIFQTTFSNAFSWMEIYEFWLRFQWSLFLRIQLTIFQYWFR